MTTYSALEAPARRPSYKGSQSFALPSMSGLGRSPVSESIGQHHLQRRYPDSQVDFHGIRITTIASTTIPRHRSSVISGSNASNTFQAAMKVSVDSSADGGLGHSTSFMSRARNSPINKNSWPTFFESDVSSSRSFILLHAMYSI